MLVQGEGEGVLFIRQAMYFCLLPEGEGVHLLDITGWMVRRATVAPVVSGDIRLVFGGEGLGGSLVNVTLMIVVTMEEWVRVGLLTDAPEEDQDMAKGADPELRAGWEAEPGE